MAEFLRGTWESERAEAQSAPLPLPPVFSEPLTEWLPEAEMQPRSLRTTGQAEGKPTDDVYMEPTLAMKVLYGAFFLEAPKIKATHL